MNNTILTVWAAGWLTVAVTVAVAVAAGRIGAARAGAWLVVLGLGLLTLEEPALTLWLALTGPEGDRDGMATLVTPVARAHVLDAAVVAIAAALLLGRIAMTALRRGDRWAHRVLRWGLAVATVTKATTTVFVSSRGLGWQPVAVGLLAWGLGLWIARPSQVAAAMRPAVPVRSAP